MRAMRVLLAGALFVAVVVRGGGAEATNAGDVHLPDLQTRQPSTLVVTDSGTFLRFSNTVWNGGNGPLELRPEYNTQTGKTDAYQRFYTHTKRKGWTFVSESEAPVGSFEFHLNHNHWHFDDFAKYELEPLAGGAPIPDTKQTFCIAETDYFGGNTHAAKRRTYPTSNCGKDKLQGLGPGWGDRYPYYVSGQEIAIGTVPAGYYCLRSTADPLEVIEEMNDGNNVGAITISLTAPGPGRTVTIESSTC